MRIRKVLALRGPNVWARFAVLEAWVDLADLKDSPSDRLPGFNDRLMEWLPTMIEHRCSEGTRGGFFERLRRGTYLAHILEHVTLELQGLARSDVGFGRARETSEEGVYRVAIEFEDESLARECLATGLRLCLAAVHGTLFQISAEVERLRRLAEQTLLGPSTKAIADAATARGIPVRRLNSGSLLLLGHGARQRRILAAETDRTGAIAESIAQDKQLTRELLGYVGIPTPTGRVVEDALDAWQAALELGLPIVVKPQFGSQGRGVTTDVRSRDQVLAAYDAARREDRAVIVESFALGDDYRLLIVGGSLVAAARREPPFVLGDGTHTVAELVTAENRDPRRSDDHANVWSKIPLDQITLATLQEQGLEPTSVPMPGRRVTVRRNANLSTGGTATDVTDRVHPEVAQRAIEAARVVGLDVAGVDVVARDIGRPLEDQQGVVLEVNAAPGLRMHVRPSAGAPRPVGEAIVRSLFPPGVSGRIPLAAVTGTNGKTTTARLIAHFLRQVQNGVALTCTDGIYIDDRRIAQGDCSGPKSAKAVLLNPAVQAAVLETARGGILREGLGFDQCQVGVVTNVSGADHLGLGGIDTAEKMAVVKRTVVEAVAVDGYSVLNVGDPLVAGMASFSPGKVIYFGRNPEHGVLTDHRASGGRVVTLQDGQITLCQDDRYWPVVALDSVPLTRRGQVTFMVDNVLAAVAAAWGLALGPAQIADGLASFAPDAAHLPGRFNVHQVNGATVIVDYGHNPSALAALISAATNFPHARRVAVYSVAGDRRDEDMVLQGQILGEAFDHVVLYEDQYTRGRPTGEIMALLGRGLAQGARVRKIENVQGALFAVKQVLDQALAGDLIVVQADVIEETLAFLDTYMKDHPPRAGMRRVDVPQPAISTGVATGAGSITTLEITQPAEPWLATLASHP